MLRTRAALPFLFFTALSVSVRAADEFVIIEFSASGSELRDEDGERVDWIEVYNRASVPLDLNGWSLSDDAADLRRWTFPERTVPDGGFVVVFASGKNRLGAELHTDFCLAVGGEYLALVSPDGRLTSEFAPAYPVQEAGLSYGDFMHVRETVLFDDGAAARFLVPTAADAALNWRGRSGGFRRQCVE